MARFFARLLLVPLGILLATFGAAFVLIAGALASGYGSRLLEVVSLLSLSALALVMSGSRPEDLGLALVVLWIIAIIVLAGPMVLLALVSELFGVSRFLAHILAGGALYSLVPILFPGNAETYGWPHSAVTGFAAAGFVGGFIYWAIAGHGASRPEVPPALPA